MAVQTIDLPVIGKTKTTWVYAGGAAVVGVGIFAWATRDKTPGAEGAGVAALYDEFGNPIGVVTDDSYNPPTVTGGGQVIDENRPNAPITNSEWTLLATDHLSRNGWDPILVSVALGKFLLRQTLTPQQAEAVGAAIAAYGQPPQGGPWPLLQPQAPAPTPKGKPGAISGLRLAGRSRTSLTWAWNASPNTDYYKVIGVAGVSTILRNTTVIAPTFTLGGLQPKHPYRIRVRAERRGVGTTDYATRVDRTA